MHCKTAIFLCSVLFLGSLLTACGTKTSIVLEPPTAVATSVTPGTTPGAGQSPTPGSNPPSASTPPSSSSSSTPAPVIYGDLTGVWKGDDNAYYYARQIGNQVSWVGIFADDGVSYTNVLCATRTGNSVSGNWADVPRGNTLQSGSLAFQVDGSNPSDIQLHRTATNVFGAATWHKVDSWPSRYPTYPAEHLFANNATDVTGTWYSTVPADNSQYYIHQVGNLVWWLGISNNNGLSFANVFCGQRSDDTFTGTWADVLYGGTSTNHGTLSLTYYRDGSFDRFKVLTVTGGFGTSQWTRFSA